MQKGKCECDFVAQSSCVKILYGVPISSTGMLLANGCGCGQDLKQNKQIEKESLVVNDIIVYYLNVLLVSCPSEKLSKV